jgi:cellulose synthase/poly-beta-1,6-N-acetylglucosamine synthase-like glycosyltransferase
MLMEIIIAGIFWIIIYLLIHTYLVYPLSLVLISVFKGKLPQHKIEHSPSVSILISAFNEEKVIAKRIENISKLQYDFSKVEVLVGSDNSTDGTNEILNEQCRKHKWLKVKGFNVRGGKASVLNTMTE